MFAILFSNSRIFKWKKAQCLTFIVWYFESQFTLETYCNTLLCRMYLSSGFFLQWKICLSPQWHKSIKSGVFSLTESATVIKLLIFLLSSAFESIGGKYYPCQILSCNSNRKFDYFERNFHIRFAAITQFKNVREQHRELGRGERDVMLSLHFRKESSPLSSNYHSG